MDVDPDTLNKKSRGQWVTAFITLPEGHEVGNIDLTSITITALLSGDGQCAPNYLQAADLSFTPQIGDRDEDGISDLTVKFDRQVLLPALCPGDVGITIQFLLTDGTTFIGSDFIRVIDRGK